MRIVIVGAGRAGLEVATHLTRLGHAITIVDSDELVTRRYSLGQVNEAFTALRQGEVVRGVITF